MLELLEKSALQTEVRSESGQRLATVAVVGLGYVGLPLAVEFGKHRPTVGYDLSRKKIENIQRRVDTDGDHAVVILRVVDAEYREKVQPLTIAETPWEYGG